MDYSSSNSSVKKSYRETHREQANQRSREWRAANKERVSEYNKAYNDANKEQLIQYRKARHEVHREHNNQASKKYYKSHRESRLQSAKAYSETHKEHRLAYSASHREQRRGTHLARRYGISLEDFNLMLFRQMGLCAICGNSPQEGKKLVVDHCHLTGNVRELLCDDCNHMIGNAGDNWELLIKAAQYLKKHSM